MGYAKYVGRIGALAVALGIGTAVAQPALAETPHNDTESSTNTTNEQSAPPDETRSAPTAPTADGPKNENETQEDDDSPIPDAIDGSDEDESDDDSEPLTSTGNGVEPEDTTVPEPPAPPSIPDLPAAGSDPTAQDPPADPDEPSIPPATTGGTLNANDTSYPETGPTVSQQLSRQTLTVEPSSDPDLFNALSVSESPTFDSAAAIAPTIPSPAPIQPQPDNPIEIVFGTAGTLINIAAKAIGMLFSPFFTAGYNGPGGFPLIWATLDLVRRELERAFFNTSPNAVADITTTSELVPTTIAVLANDTDWQGDLLTVVGYTEAHNGTVVLNSDGSFTYTPDAGFTGVDTFSYTISDEAGPWHLHGLRGLLLRGGHAATAAVTITVESAPSNVAPIADDDAATLTQGSGPRFIDVLDNDSDSDGDALSVTGVTQPSDGTVTFTTTGVSYTPNTDFAGTDTFTYTLSDGTTTAIGTVTVTVTPVVPNTAPTAVNDEATTAEDTAVDIEVTANDTDAESDSLDVTAASGAQHGVLVIDGNTITYTPNANWHGIDSFTYTISDGEHEATATVSVTVMPVNDAPVADTLAPVTILTVDADGVLKGKVNVTDPDSTLTYTVVGTVSGGDVIIAGDGSFTFTPSVEARETAYGTTGPDYGGFTVEVSDGVNPVVTVSATVVITPLAPGDDNSAPEVADPAFAYTTHPISGITSGTVDATDPDLDELTYTVTDGPSADIGEVVIDPETGAWAFRPSAQARFDAWNQAGGLDVTFTISVSDGVAATAIDVTVPVSPLAWFDFTEQDADIPPGRTFVVLDSTGRIIIGAPDGLSVINPDGSPGSPITLGFRPTDAVADSTGRIYVTNALNGEISVIDPSTHGVAVLATLPNATRIAIDDAGLLYVTRPADRAVTTLGADGSVLGTTVLDGIPSDIAIASEGRIYIVELADDLNEVRLTRRDHDGTHITVLYEGTTSALGSYAAPLGLAIGPNGAVYLSDPNQNRVHVIGADGVQTNWVYVENLSGGIAVLPTGEILALTAGDLPLVLLTPFVSDRGDYSALIDRDTGVVNGEVFVLAPPGTLTYELASTPDPKLGTVSINTQTGEWQFVPTEWATYKAWLGEANYSLEYDSYVEFVITASNGTSVTVGAGIVGVAKFEVGVVDVVGGTPSMVAVDTAGRLYVVDAVAKSVSVINPDGSLEATISLDFTPSSVAAVTGGGRPFLVLANGVDNTLTIIDPSTNYSVAAFPLTGFPVIDVITMDEDGGLYVGNRDSDTVTVFTGGSTWTLSTPNPAAITVDRYGAIYVVGTDDDGAGYLRIYESNGDLVSSVVLGGSPSGVAVGPTGHVFVSDASGSPRDLAILDSYGWLSQTIEIGGAGTGIAVGGDGRIYIANPSSGTVTVLTPKVISEPAGPAGSLSTINVSGLALIAGIAVRPDGQIVITGANNSGQFVLGYVSPGGTFTEKVTLGSGSVGLVLGPDGRYYVSDYANGTVTAFDPADSFSAELIASIPGAASMAFGGDGTLYVTRTYTAIGLVAVRPDGTVEDIDVAGGLAYGVAAGPDGSVFVSYFDNTGRAGILVLRADGTTQNIGVPAGIGPSNVLVAADGTVYITDVAQGKLIVQYTSGVTRAVDITEQPYGLALGEDGRVYVTHPVNNVITVLTPGPYVNSPVRLTDSGGRYIQGAGVIGGEIEIYNTDADVLSFSVEPDFDSTIGSVTFDELTGRWRLTTTAQAMADALEAWLDPAIPNHTVKFTISVTDGQYSDSVELEVEIYPNRPPVAEVPPFSVTDTYDGTVYGTINVTDLDGDSLSYELTTAPDPAIGEVSLWGSEWGFTPSAQARLDAAASPGDDVATFTFTVTDGSSTVTIPVTVRIIPQTPPVVGTPTFHISDIDPETGVVRGTVSVSDPDGDFLRYSATGIDSQNGSVTVNFATGEWEFRPTALARYNAMFGEDSGTVTFSIEANDGWHTAEIEVDVDVLPGLDPAVLQQLAANGDVLISENADGTIRAIHGTFVPRLVSSIDDAAELLNAIAPLIGAEAGFASAAAITVQQTPGLDSSAGEKFYRLKLTVNGIAVIGGGVVIVTDSSGSVTGLFANISETLTAVDATPSSTIDSEAKAIELVRQSVDHIINEMQTQSDDDVAGVLSAFAASLSYRAELVILNYEATSAPILVWRVGVLSQQLTDEGLPSATGQLQLVTTYVIQANGSSAGTILSTGLSTDAATLSQTSIGLQNVEYTFDSNWTDNGIILEDTRRKIKTYKLVRDFASPMLETFWGSAALRKEIVKKDMSQGWDKNAITAHSNMAEVYDYFDEVLDYRSFNGRGATISIYVGYTFNNAMWMPSSDQFRFGAGAYEAALDIVAHEFTHGVIEYIVGGGVDELGLDSTIEANALDEAYGDILGSLTEASVEGLDRNADERWQIGEDLTRADPLRDMTKHAFVDPGETDYYVLAEAFDHAFYLMVTDPDNPDLKFRGKGRTANITDDQWARVFFGSLYRLNPSSTLVDARSAIISTAMAKGFTQTEIEAIQDAFDHVGIRAASYRYGSYQTIDIGGTPGNMTISDSGSRAFVITSGTAVKIVDTRATPKPTVTTVVLDSYSSAIAVSSNGDRAFVVGNLGVTVINVASRVLSNNDTGAISKMSVSLPSTVGNWMSIGTNADGTRAFVTNSDGTVAIIEYNNGSPTVSHMVSIGGLPSDIAVSADGSTAVVTNLGLGQVSIVDSSGRVTRANVGSSTGSVAVSDDGKRAVAYIRGGGVFVIDTSTGAFERVNGIFSYRAQGFLAISGDGKRAYVTDHEASVTIIDIETAPGSWLVKGVKVVSLIDGKDDYNDLVHSVATTADGSRAFIVTHANVYIILPDGTFYTANGGGLDVNNNASEYQQVAVSVERNIVITTDIGGKLTVLNGRAF